MHVYLKAKRIVQRLKDAGFTAYFAGGWVRDYLLEHPSDDIDVATNASPDQVQAVFEKTVAVGASFGVVIVIEDGQPFEVASFRKDGLYVDGRKPESVDWATAEEDASRRDFTINGMFYDPIVGEVIDYVGGKEDLKRGVIRSIGSAEMRFREDRLRIIRAVRFATRFGFYIDREIEEAIPLFYDKLFPSIAKERLWQELKKMRPMSEGILMLHRYRLFDQIFPCMPHMDEEELHERVLHFRRFPVETPTVIYVAELFPETPLAEVLRLLEHFRVSGDEKTWVKRLYMVRDCMASGDLRERLYAYALPEVATLMAVLNISYVKEAMRFSQHVERIRKKRPLVNAERLMREGVRPGPQMGELLREAERLAIETNSHDVEQVVNLLKQTKLWSQ